MLHFFAEETSVLFGVGNQKTVSGIKLFVI